MRARLHACTLACVHLLALFFMIFWRNLKEFCSFLARKAYGTRCSQAVPHPSTILARRCLTSVIGRERVCSSWYGRRQRGDPILACVDAFFKNFSMYPGANVNTPECTRRACKGVQNIENIHRIVVGPLGKRHKTFLRNFIFYPWWRHKRQKRDLSSSQKSTVFVTDKKYQTTYSHWY